MKGGIAPQNPESIPDEEGNASPEEQAAYEAFVKTGMKLVYGGGEVRPGILKMLDEEPSDLIAAIPELQGKPFDPLVALAATTVVVVIQAVKDSAEKPADEIIFHGGQEILEQLADVAEAAGYHTYSEDEIGNAFRMAADLYREAGAAQGLVDLDAVKSEWGEIVEADKAGKLGEVVPGLPQETADGA